MEAEDFTEGECLPTPDHCGCIGHTFPGVSHMVACCDVPHITQEEFDKRFGTED